MNRATVKFKPLNVLGLMSGTSLDGVDAVLVRLEQTERLEWRVLARHSLEYAPDLRERLYRAIQPDSDVVLLTQLHTEVAHVYREVVAHLQTSHTVDLVALSGQTVYHIPRVDEKRGWRTPSTLQLGEASIVAEGCKVAVFSDFRQADMAAGGGGAPMVSFGDAKLFAEPGKARAVHNLGGISNLTYLPKSTEADTVFAFDTGPANCLVDEAAQRYFGVPFDANGELAARGKIVEDVLERLLRHPYFELPPPKTTGREVFALRELDVGLDGLEPHDVLATLTALTAESVARAYRDFVPTGLDEILVAGGGALNETLLKMLRERLGVPVVPFEELGWQSKDREALAFAVMAYFARFGQPNTLPGATGARHPVVAGKLSRPYLG